MTTRTPDEQFVQSLNWMLDEEGGFAILPNDRGGATFNGVTQATYDSWRNLKKLTKQSVRKATADEIKELYDIMFWRAAGCDRLPWPINYLVFDAAVNSGVNRGVRWMQAGVGVTADGKIGPATRAAAQKVLDDGDTKAILEIVNQRLTFLVNYIRKVPSQQDFMLGWWRRTQRVLGRGLLEAFGGDD